MCNSRVAEPHSYTQTPHFLSMFVCHTPGHCLWRAAALQSFSGQIKSLRAPFQEQVRWQPEKQQAWIFCHTEVGQEGLLKWPEHCWHKQELWYFLIVHSATVEKKIWHFCRMWAVHSCGHGRICVPCKACLCNIRLPGASRLFAEFCAPQNPTTYRDITFCCFAMQAEDR